MVSPEGTLMGTEDKLCVPLHANIDASDFDIYEIS